MASENSIQPFDQKRRLHIVQAGAMIIFFVFLFSQPVWSEESFIGEFLESLGFILILLCILGRLWSILYIGNHKNKTLITRGPYSVSRNPLYFFSTVGIVGVGLISGTVLFAAAIGFASFLIFSITALKESAFLKFRFGEDYLRYVERTPVFWPNPALYVEANLPTFCPQALKRTFIDTLYYLALFPIIESIEYFHEIGSIPTFIYLF